MDKELLIKYLETTKFTTNKTDRRFVPRRVGLGYDLLYEFNDTDIIKEVKKKSRKKASQDVKKEKTDVEEDEMSKFSLMKKRR